MSYFLAYKLSLSHLKGSFNGPCCLASKQQLQLYLPFTSSSSCPFKPQIKTLQEEFIQAKSVQYKGVDLVSEIVVMQHKDKMMQWKHM